MGLYARCFACIVAFMTLPASAAAEVDIQGTPTVTYVRVADGDARFYSLAAVFRLNEALTDRSETAIVTGPRLRTGRRVGSTFGGGPVRRIGLRSQHCYSAEIRRPRPTPKPRTGARWRLGISTGEGRYEDTAGITLRRAPHSNWQRRAAKRLNCYSKDDDEKNGARSRGRIRVCAVTDVFAKPGHVYRGRLRPPESFRVGRYSPSGKYAHGFAYGNANKAGWIRSSRLCEDNATRDSARRNLVGERVPVREGVDQLLVSKRPNAGFVGSLQHPETFWVGRLSPSGKYAYGFAYGNANTLGWVRASDLQPGSQ